MRDFKKYKKNIIACSDKMIPKILSYFGLDDIVDDHLILKGGVANINYLVKVKNDFYVIKIFLNAKTKNLLNELTIQNQLDKNGINCPKYIKGNTGDYLFNKNGIVASIYKFIPGVECSNITNKFCYDMGKVLAEFHKSVTHLKHPHCGWLNRNSDIIRLINKISDDKVKKLISRLSDLKNINENIIYSVDLPSGIIHGDLYEGNVLVDTKKGNSIVAIFDFEHTEENIFILDMARTILSIAEEGTSLNKDMIQSTIDGYNSIRPLSKLEIKFIPNAIKYVAGIGGLWLIYHGEIKLAHNYLMKGISM